MLLELTSIRFSEYGLLQFLDSVLTTVRTYCPADSANITLIDMDERMWIAAFQNGDGVESLLPSDLTLEESYFLNEMHTSFEPVIVPDTKSDPNWKPFPTSDAILGYVGFTIVLDGVCYGFIQLNKNKLMTPDAVNNFDLEWGIATAKKTALVLENIQIYEEIQRHAITDPLTGMFNRRHFFNLGYNEFDRAHNRQHDAQKGQYTGIKQPLSVIMLDIDHFKQVNDIYGHKVGDQVLRGMKQRISDSLRPIDTFGRYGGEEISVLLPEATQKVAYDAAERIRTGINDQPFTVELSDGSKKDLKISVSLGVAELEFGMPKLETLLDCADQALYIAKQNGRNNVELYQE